MMNHRVVCLLVTAAAGICLATAQSSAHKPQVGSSSAKSAADSLTAATKPLTPKSAMPARRKSSLVVPNTSKSRNTTAELTHLEQQNPKTGASKSGNTPTAKAAPAKSADKSAGSDSGINFKYQKPAGGLKASTPDAHSPNSSTPRVKKN